METIKIKYLSNEIDKIKFIGGKSDWYDLRSREDIEIKKGETAYIHLGVAMKLPDGYEAYIVPRSSTMKNFGVIQTNNIGIIDSSYCGDGDEWIMPVMAVRDTCIRVNDRVCQFRIQKKQPEINFKEVNFLDDKDRGGFGSTGKS